MHMSAQRSASRRVAHFLSAWLLVPLHLTQLAGMPCETGAYDVACCTPGMLSCAALQDTGQLSRVGEGADTTRVAHHYLEDWNTGDFFMMAEPSTGCLGWLR